MSERSMLALAGLLFVLLDCTPLRLLVAGKGLWRRLGIPAVYRPRTAPAHGGPYRLARGRGAEC